ncbi:Transcriptional regulator GlxA family, contains an amidase domain and an AraC-type DNA-binding HTH domain [Chitinophaga sp. CF118]|uniref:GlxA family transcriptional regulator n=1 Tax=Chitinophaga sp. CF118 TaxID=1884367 RepID=UPI0008ECA6AD|nr:helix-turn-helix domain-containing protein [Chitinophaga sp. CF118]SFF00985.1 Transcriptional regulator GlxA family, contains an amidase domain and an AraC-type DNA-binding HTH domain [Chitinophaga sp. CF118]
MIKLALLVTHKHRLISIAAILDVFDTVNSYYAAIQQPPFFNIQLVVPDNDERALLPSYEHYTSVNLSDADAADLVLIPAFVAEDLEQALAANCGFVPWIREQYRNKAEIASFCTGAFLLGATGLLNGKPATTHVMARSAFAGVFPEVNLQSDKVLTAAEGIYTSGGATSTFHLLLYLVEKYCGRPVAIRTAKVFAIDMDRYTQAYFSVFVPEKHHTDDLITEVQQRMEKGYKDANTVEAFMEDIPASRRNFVRRFKHATGITPIEYLQKTRVEAAKRLLEQTGNSILAVMLDCGYNDIKAFRKVFRKEVGLTPTEYRVKFSGGSRKILREEEV